MCFVEPILSGLPNEIMAINKMVVRVMGLQQALMCSLFYEQDTRFPGKESNARTGDYCYVLLIIFKGYHLVNEFRPAQPN